MKHRRDQVKEIMKCGTDPVYFINKYVKIQHPIKGLIDLKTFSFQQNCLNDFEKYQFNITLKSRQLGLSTISAAYAVWLAIFHREKNILVIATKLSTAMNFIKKVKVALAALPVWLKLPKEVGIAKTEVSFDNGSQIKAIPTSEDAGRSEALSLLIVDEAAFIRDFGSIWTGLYPTLSCLTAETRVITESGYRKIGDMCYGDPGDYTLISNKVNVWARDGFEPLSHTYVSPKSVVKKIVTKSGRVIRCTQDHPLWTLRGTSTEMIKSKDILVGDHLKVYYGQNVFGNQDHLLTTRQAYQLGVFIAEGWIPRQAKDDDAKRYSIYISNTDEEIRDIFIEDGFKEQKDGKLALFSRDAVVQYEKWGVDPRWKCDTKEVPQAIWSSTKDIQVAFLRGYFDGNGSASYGVSASTTSERLSQDIQLLLLNLGILCRVKKHLADSKKAGRGTRIMPSGQVLQSVRDAWGIAIPRSQLKLFNDLIGFGLTRKIDEASRWIKTWINAQEKSTRLRELPQDVAQKVVDIFRSSKLRSNTTYSALRRVERLRLEKNPTQEVAHRVLHSNLLNLTHEERIWLNEISTENTYWDEIVEITDDVEEITYDFTVPGSHTFLQNNILGSNTGGRAIIISTPNGTTGVGQQYYRMWTEAEAGQNDFNPIRLDWSIHPEHDQKWFDTQARQLGDPKRIAQELLCVAEGSKIITKDGYKYIEDLSVGDLVLTHCGRFKPINQIRSRIVEQNETLYEVNSPGNRSQPFFITGNHPTLSYRFWANTSALNTIVNDTNAKATWIDFDTIASKRKVTDKIINVLFPCIAQPQRSIETIDLSTLYESCDVSENECRYRKQSGSTKRFVNVDFDLGKFIGLYLAEGCNHRGGIDLGFHIDEHDTHASWCVEFIKSLNGRVTLLKNKIHKSCRLWTFNKHIRGLVRYFVQGNVAHEKILNLDNVLACGSEFIKGLLFGHYLGDGDHKHDKKFKIVSVSSKLIYQLRTLNSMFNLYPRIGFNKSNNPKRHDGWLLEFQAEGVSYLDLLESGQQIKSGSRTRIKSGQVLGCHTIKDASAVRDVDGGVVVYDIQVEDDHSFVVESAVVHNCDFLASGDTFLQPNDLEWVRSMIRDPIDKTGYARNVWVWHHPEPNKKYVLSSDVSRGDASDYSTFHIIDTTTNICVAEFMGKLPPDRHGELCGEWGAKYNNALIAVESNTYGYMTNVKLRDSNYPHLFYKKCKVDPLLYSPEDDELPGFDNQKKTRTQILSQLETSIRNKTLVSHSRRLYEQLNTFVWNNGKPMASSDSHDDLVISIAIGCWLIDGGTRNESSSELARAMLRATTKGEGTRVNQLRGLDQIKPIVNPNLVGSNPQSVYRPRDPAQIKKLNPNVSSLNNFDWLL